MAEDVTLPACADDVPQVSSEEDSKAEAHRRQIAGLKPRRKGDPPLNPDGKNGHRARQELIAAILDEPDDDGPLEPGCSRIRSVVLATVKLAKNARASGASGAQKTCIEHYAGKARAQVDLSNEDESLVPALVRVFGVKPADADGVRPVQVPEASKDEPT